jgi:hypothetical protein
MMGATIPVISWGNVDTVTNRQRRRIVRAIERRQWLAEALDDMEDD